MIGSRHRVAAVLPVACLTILGLTACGGGDSASSSSAAPASSANGDEGRGMRPGVSGVISGTGDETVTVTDSQGSSSTIDYDKETSITKQESATASIVATGACVSVRQQMSGGPGAGDRPTGDPGQRPTDGTTPQAPPSQDLSQPVAATTVVGEPASSCDDTSRGGGFGGLTGTITSTGDGTFTMQALVVSGGPQGRPTGSPTSSSTPTERPSATPTSVTVTMDGNTTYEQRSEADATALTAGLCLTAMGETSGDTLTARSLVISTSQNGTCDSGFGMGRG